MPVGWVVCPIEAICTLLPRSLGLRHHLVIYLSLSHHRKLLACDREKRIDAGSIVGRRLETLIAAILFLGSCGWKVAVDPGSWYTHVVMVVPQIRVDVEQGTGQQGKNQRHERQARCH